MARHGTDRGWLSRVLALASAAWSSGCLWIGPGAHEEREHELVFSLGELEVAPEGLTACRIGQRLLTVTAPVGSVHDGQSFAVTVGFDGADDVEVGPVVALDGALSFTVEVPDWTDDPDCAVRCDRALTVTAERLGYVSSASVDVALVGDVAPVVSRVDAVAANGDVVALPSVVLAADPPGSLLASAWPELRVTVADPNGAVGAIGQLAVWACPTGASPGADPGGTCAVAVASPQDTLADPIVASVSTAALASAVCSGGEIPPEWWLYVRIDGHPCGTFTFPADERPILVVRDDCDGDGVGPSGDCDDLADVTYPGAPELCDGRDNDCVGGEGTNGATLFTAAGGAVPYTDVAEAISAASAGDTVGVCPGTYAVNLAVSESIAVDGAGDAAEVVLAAAVPGDPVVAVRATGVDLTLSDLTLTGASAVDAGGGLDARLAGSVVLERCIVAGNEADRGGGLALAGDVDLADTEISDNVADEGGGMSLEAGTGAQLTGVTVLRNTATLGGGVWVEAIGGPVDVVGDAELSENTASGAGGGLWLAGIVTLSGLTVSTNDAVSGGGVFLEAAGLGVGQVAFTLDGVTIDDNAAIDGGGVSVHGPAIAALTATTLRRNTALGAGGGLRAVADPVGGVTLTLTAVVIEDNAAGADGGGLFVADGAVVADGTSIATNTAERGGGLALVDATAALGAVAAVDLKGNGAGAVGGAGFVLRGVLDAPAGLTDANTASDGAGWFFDGATATLGGTVQQNSPVGFVVTGGASITIDATAVLTGNDRDRVDLGRLEVCAGATVDDTVLALTADPGGDADCYVLTESAYTDGCSCP